jgi:MoaA/NifB/PqqE/SkfB family radical SAM enzyme
MNGRQRSRLIHTLALALHPLEWQKPISPRMFLSKSFDLYITHLCNLRCTYCYLKPEFLDAGDRKANHLRHMSLKRAKSIFAYMQSGGMEEVVLLGGEPSLHPQFAEMIIAADAAGLRVRVVTNGHKNFRNLLRTNERVRNILQTNGSVAVSLDSPDKALFNSFRMSRAQRDGRAGGVSAYDEATQMISLLRDMSVRFQINATLTASTCRTASSMMKFADASGAELLNIHWYSKMGTGAQFAPDEVPRPEQWRDVVLQTLMYVSERPGFKVDCELSYWYAVVGADPDMCLLRDFGNLQILPQGEAYGCGAAMDEYDSAYYWFDGDKAAREGLYVRPAGESNELTVVQHASGAGCPIREHQEGAIPLCIYNRDARVRSGQRLAGKALRGNDRFLVPGGYRHLSRQKYFQIMARASYVQEAAIQRETIRHRALTGQIGLGDVTVEDAEARYETELEKLAFMLIENRADVVAELRDGGAEWFALAARVFESHISRQSLAQDATEVHDAVQKVLTDYQSSAIKQHSLDERQNYAEPLFQLSLPGSSEAT